MLISLSNFVSECDVWFQITVFEFAVTVQFCGIALLQRVCQHVRFLKEGSLWIIARTFKHLIPNSQKKIHSSLLTKSASLRAALIWKTERSKWTLPSTNWAIILCSTIKSIWVSVFRQRRLNMERAFSHDLCRIHMGLTNTSCTVLHKLHSHKIHREEVRKNPT